MFYSEDQISKYLLCQKCENRFDEPSVLPCGKMVCSTCVQDLTKRFLDNQFKCICLNDHVN